MIELILIITFLLINILIYLKNCKESLSVDCPVNNKKNCDLFKTTYANELEKIKPGPDDKHVWNRWQKYDGTKLDDPYSYNLCNA